MYTKGPVGTQMLHFHKHTYSHTIPYTHVHIEKKRFLMNTHYLCLISNIFLKFIQWVYFLRSIIKVPMSFLYGSD